MDLNKFGPFANIVATAAAIVAVFSLFAVKMIGRISRWTWLLDNPPSFLISAGARVLAIALMAVSYIYMTRLNSPLFAALAVLSGALGFFCIIRFDFLRKRFIIKKPLVGEDGSQLRRNGRLMFENLIIGDENRLNEEAAEAYAMARRTHGVSLEKFLSGYGAALYDPGALWAKEHLAKISNALTTYLIAIVLFAVLTLFLAALLLDTMGKAVS